MIVIDFFFATLLTKTFEMNVILSRLVVAILIYYLALHRRFAEYLVPGFVELYQFAYS